MPEEPTYNEEDIATAINHQADQQKLLKHLKDSDTNERLSDLLSKFQETINNNSDLINSQVVLNAIEKHDQEIEMKKEESIAILKDIKAANIPNWLAVLNEGPQKKQCQQIANTLAREAKVALKNIKWCNEILDLSSTIKEKLKAKLASETVSDTQETTSGAAAEVVGDSTESNNEDLEFDIDDEDLPDLDISEEALLDLDIKEAIDNTKNFCLDEGVTTENLKILTNFDSAVAEFMKQDLTTDQKKSLQEKQTEMRKNLSAYCNYGKNNEGVGLKYLQNLISTAKNIDELNKYIDLASFLKEFTLPSAISDFSGLDVLPNDAKVIIPSTVELKTLTPASFDDSTLDLSEIERNKLFSQIKDGLKSLKFSGQKI